MRPLLAVLPRMRAERSGRIVNPRPSHLGGCRCREVRQSPVRGDRRYPGFTIARLCGQRWVIIDRVE